MMPSLTLEVGIINQMWLWEDPSPRFICLGVLVSTKCRQGGRLEECLRSFDFQLGRVGGVHT
jgi:hypothetical protein